MIRTAAEVLDEIERACLVANKAINEGRWHDCNEACILQRTLTHELEHAFRAFPPGPSQERAVAELRIQRIVKYREGQLARVRAFHDGVGKRLATLQRFRKFAKTVGAPPSRAALLDGTF